MKTEIIYFSATGTTKAIVTAISKGLNGKVHFTDITLPDKRKDVIAVDSDLVIIAIPVYGEWDSPRSSICLWKHGIWNQSGTIQ